MSSSPVLGTAVSQEQLSATVSEINAIKNISKPANRLMNRELIVLFTPVTAEFSRKSLSKLVIELSNSFEKNCWCCGWRGEWNSGSRGQAQKSSYYLKAAAQFPGTSPWTAFSNDVTAPAWITAGYYATSLNLPPERCKKNILSWWT